MTFIRKTGERTIQRVEPPNYSAIGAVCNACFESTDAASLAGRLRLADAATLVDVLYDDGKPFAVCVSDSKCLQLLAVLPEYRGMYHASGLLDNAEGYARHSGTRRFELEFELPQDSSGFFAHRGYSETGGCWTKVL